MGSRPSDILYYGRIYPYTTCHCYYHCYCKTNQRRKDTVKLLLTNNKYMDSYNSPSTKPLYRGTQVVWYLLGLIEVLLAFRFLLKLFSANPSAAFSSFIYTLSKPFVLPFTAVFGTSRLENSIFEWTTILAMIVYVLVGWGIIKILSMSKTVSTPEAASKLNQN